MRERGLPTKLRCLPAFASNASGPRGGKQADAAAAVAEAAAAIGAAAAAAPTEALAAVAAASVN